MIDESNIQQLVSAASGVEPTAPAAVAQFAGIEVPALNTALAEATQNRISDLSSLQTITEEWQQLPQLRTRLQELEAQTAVDPFASPLVKHLNEMARAGAKPTDFETYVRLSSVNPAEMSTAEVLRMKLSLDPVGYTKAQIDSLIETEYGLGDGVDESQLPAIDQAKLMRAKHDAVEFLNSKRISFEPTAAAPPDPSIEAERQRHIQGWTQQILPAMKAEAQFSWQGDPETGRTDYSFVYQASPELARSVSETLAQQIAQNPQAFPLTSEGVEAAKQMYQKLLIVADPAAYSKALVMDIYASLQQQIAAKNAGSPPVRPEIVVPQSIDKGGPKPGQGKGLSLDQISAFAINKR